MRPVCRETAFYAVAERQISQCTNKAVRRGEDGINPPWSDLGGIELLETGGKALLVKKTKKTLQSLYVRGNATGSLTGGMLADIVVLLYIK